MGANKILEVMNYSYYYDQICAVRELSFHVNEGEVVTLIGSNGAGKTTTLRSISGLIRGGGRGGIKYMGKNIENLPPHRISSMGIAQCLEGRQVFPHLSVKENLQMGAFTRTDKKGFRMILIMYIICSPGFWNGKGRWREPFQAANSRCWLWEGP